MLIKMLCANSNNFSLFPSNFSNFLSLFLLWILLYLLEYYLTILVGILRIYKIDQMGKEEGGTAHSRVGATLQLRLHTPC